MPLIFVGGTHGTGKTTFASALCRRLPAVLLTASAIIRDNVPEPLSIDKRVIDIDGNQERLLKGLATLRARHSLVVLDGHYSVRGPSGDPVAIAAEVFNAIAPDALLLIEESPPVIVERLRRRDGVRYEVAEVISLVAFERGAASALSAALNLPLCIMRASDGVDSALEHLLPLLKQ